MLIKTMKMRLDELALYAAVDLGSFLFGSLLLVLITYMDGSEGDFTVFRMGTVMAWIIFFFISVGMGMFGMKGYFNWHVGFGRTRKSFFVCDMATELCWNLISLVFIGVLCLVEGGILKVFYGSFREGKEIVWGAWLIWAIPVAALLLTVSRELTGCLLLRFGNKAFWVMWAVWMLVCLLPGRLAESKNSGIEEMAAGLVTWLTGISITGWIIMGVIMVSLLLGISWLIIRKHAVEG